MKKLLLSAAALVILSAPVAMAQDQNNNDQPKQERPNRGDNDNNNKGDQDRGGGDKMNGPGGAMQGGGGAMNGPGGGDRNSNNNDQDNNRGNANNRNNNNNANDRDKKVVVHKTVDRSVILKVRANITAPRKFHAARAYVRPQGWYAHRWVFGETLPRVFFASDYWLTDYATYGLMAPWDGYEWVRYGDDALLIDVDTGEVIRVEYGLFD
jgi:Ni/Co efflux regulator RcnB